MTKNTFNVAVLLSNSMIFVFSVVDQLDNIYYLVFADHPERSPCFCV